MKRLQLTFLIGVVLVVLLAGIAFYRQQSRGPQDIIGVTATSSPAAEPSVSPDALVAVPPPAATSSVAAADLRVKAAAVEDLATGALLYKFNADVRWPIASITKLMTAEVILDHMDLNATITMSAADFAGGGSNLTANLEPGDQYRVADLLKVLLLPSSNEAAEAFARTYGRSAFIAAMNAQAASWGLENTHFDDPSGLSAANQSTPREFLELVRQVYTLHPEIFAITQARAATVQELGTGVFKEFSTTNNFAGRAGFLGGKTGTTPEAGDNLISLFRVNRDPVAVLVFGAADRYAASESLLQLIR